MRINNNKTEVLENPKILVHCFCHGIRLITFLCQSSNWKAPFFSASSFTQNYISKNVEIWYWWNQHQNQSQQLIRMEQILQFLQQMNNPSLTSNQTINLTNKLTHQNYVRWSILELWMGQIRVGLDSSIHGSGQALQKDKGLYTGQVHQARPGSTFFFFNCIPIVYFYSLILLV